MRPSRRRHPEAHAIANLYQDRRVDVLVWTPVARHEVAQHGRHFGVVEGSHPVCRFREIVLALHDHKVLRGRQPFAQRDHELRRVHLRGQIARRVAGMHRGDVLAEGGQPTSRPSINPDSASTPTATACRSGVIDAYGRGETRCRASFTAA